MTSCPIEQYWDSLTRTCVSCVSCSQRGQRTCTNFCKFLSCRKEEGKYYDHLLGVCVSCDSICTQHPQQCAHYCEKKARSQVNLQPELRRPQAVEVEARPGNSGRHPESSASEHGGLQAGLASTGLRLSSEQLALIYCTLGLCLCAIFCCFLVALACFLRRREPLPSQCSGPRGPQAKSPHRPATEEARSEVALPPQPVETCSFCFPERRSPTQESTCTLGILGLAGTAAPQPCAHASISGLGVVRVPIGDTGPGA